MSKSKKHDEVENVEDSLPTPAADASEFKKQVEDLSEVEIEVELTEEAKNFFSDLTTAPQEEDVEEAVELPKPTTDKVNSKMPASTREGMRVGGSIGRSRYTSTGPARAHKWTHKVYENKSINDGTKTTFKG